MRVRNVLLLALLVVLAPLRASAQTDAAQSTRSNVISANPFLLLATWFNAEYERKVSEGSTLGVRFSTINLDVVDSINGNDEADYFSGRAFWRYYPSGAFRGFFFGVGAGVTGVEASGESGTALGAGFDLGYNWLLGKKQNFYISLGAGADRLFGSDLDNISLFIPTFRVINIGFAF